jgi:hypothetical protein
MTSHPTGVRGSLQRLIPASVREAYYRVAAAGLTLLFAFGVLDANEQALWGQFAVGLITLVFALVYATTPLRVALYAILGPLGAVLLYYGIVNDIRWALITAAVGQAFGIATAAAKTVQVINPDGSPVVR